MGALDVITRLLRPGDEVVTGDDLYGGTHRLLKYLATNGEIIVHHVDTTNPEKVRAVLSPKTAMVLLETPTNPLIKIVDIPTIASLTHTANPKALVAVDNTMLSPLLQNPLELGADIVYESGTKYLSGHHDLMAGVLAINDSALGDKLYFTINASGCGLAPFDSWLLMRGVKTLKVRLEQQQSNAQRIAEFLEGHGFRVRYPGLKSHPQYALHNTMARGAGAVLSFETGDVAVSERIVEAARLWAISVSFGCVNSLISMPCRMSHASIDAKTRRERELPEDIIRLCVGIEDVDDLIDDLSRAVYWSSHLLVRNLLTFHSLSKRALSKSRWMGSMHWRPGEGLMRWWHPHPDTIVCLAYRVVVYTICFVSDLREFLRVRGAMNIPQSEQAAIAVVQHRLNRTSDDRTITIPFLLISVSDSPFGFLLPCPSLVHDQRPLVHQRSRKPCGKSTQLRSPQAYQTYMAKKEQQPDRADIEI